MRVRLGEKQPFLRRPLRGHERSHADVLRAMEPKAAARPCARTSRALPRQLTKLCAVDLSWAIGLSGTHRCCQLGMGDHIPFSIQADSEMTLDHYTVCESYLLCD